MLRDFRAYQLAKEFYQACKALNPPKTLQEQLMRASSSVVLNVAEGSGKISLVDQRRFYGIALGSLRECQAILDIEGMSSVRLEKITDQLGAILFTLCRKEPGADKKANHRPIRNSTGHGD